MIDGSPTEFWSSDERRILTLAQDVVHCATEARANMPKHVALGMFEQVAADNNDNMKTLLRMTVTGQPTPQHWSFFLEIDGSPIEFSTVYTFRKNVHYTMALLGQNSVREPSIMGQYPMFVRTGTHERTTALKPLHPGTLCFSERKRSTPNNFNGGILTNAQVRSIMQASE